MENLQHISKNKFPKQEKLCGTKRIDKLFAQGESFIAYPLRVIYLIQTLENDGEESGISVLVTVSKKKFKRAVKRNRVKRLVREAYRLNKVSFQLLLKDNSKKMDIAFIYLKTELPDYKEIEQAILKTIRVLGNKTCSISDK